MSKEVKDSFVPPEGFALITGASAGIGKAIAYELASRGTHLILVARREAILLEIRSDIEARFKVHVRVIALDLSESNGINELLEQTNGLIIHTLINNAGFGSCGRFLDLELGRESAMVDLNVRVVLEMAHHFGKPMQERKSGAIMIVASCGGFQPGPGMATYFATKAFDLHFAEALHEELKASGVKVSCLCPGPTTTEFFEVANAKTLRATPIPSMSPDRVAKKAVDGMLANQCIVVPGWHNILGSWAYRFLPRFFIRKILGVVLLDRSKQA